MLAVASLKVFGVADGHLTRERRGFWSEGVELSLGNVAGKVFSIDVQIFGFVSQYLNQ